MTTPARLLTAIVVLAALAASTPAAQAASRCSAPKVAWKVEGRTVCAKVPRATAAPSPLNAALAGTWITGATETAPGGRTLAPRRLRRAVPRLAQSSTTLAKRVLALPAKPRLRAAGGRGRVVLVDEVELDRKVQPDGTVVISKGKATVFEDESKDMTAEIEARSKDGRTRLIYRPTMDDLQASRPEVGCPTADGVVTASNRFSTGGTAIALNGGRVLSSRTHRETFSVRARGQVGRDARLASVSAVAEYHLERFERGLQYEIKASLPARVSRDGAPVITGTPSVDVRVRALGHTAAEERAYERETASAVVQQAELMKTLTWQADEIRDALVIAERAWYEVPNNCADVRFVPWDAQLEEGQTLAVQGSPYARAGDAESPGTITVTSVGKGRFETVKADSDPGDRARFTATGGRPDEHRNTVYAEVIATSMAGRARGFYSAYAKEMKLPRAFTGTIASSQSMSGAGMTWAGTATYTRTSLTRLPDGSVRGWYDLTAASLAQARSWLGPSAGCRTEATGAGGTIDAGDLEVFLRPDGRREYALHYDVKIAGTYGPVDCPPGVPMPSYAGDIAAVVHSRTETDLPKGGGLRPFGADLRIAEQGLSGILGAAGMDVTADWTLAPVE